MAQHIPRRGCLWPAKSDRKQQTRGAGRFHDGAPGTDPQAGRARTPHRRPGGSHLTPPPPPHEGRGARTHAAHGPSPHHGRRVGPSRRPRQRGPVARGAVPRPRGGGGGKAESGGEGRGPPDSPRARPPRPQGGRATPPWVFKPPRRDALGTWRGGGGRGGWGGTDGAPHARRRRPGNRPTRSPPTAARSTRGASALPARDAGPQPGAGPTATRGNHGHRPTRPPPCPRSRAEASPARARARPSFLLHPNPPPPTRGPCPAPASRAPFSPPRAVREAPTGSGGTSGQGAHGGGGGRAGKRESQTDDGRRRERPPGSEDRPRRTARGRRARSRGPTTGKEPVQGRRREGDGAGERPAPHHGGGAAAATPPIPRRTGGSARGSGRERGGVTGAGDGGARGGGGSAPPPPPEPSDPNLEGRGGEVGRERRAGRSPRRSRVTRRGGGRGSPRGDGVDPQPPGEEARERQTGRVR